MSDVPQASRQDALDAEHLQLLAIFHYIVGGLMILFASIFIIHTVMGIVMVVDPDVFEGPEGRPPGFPRFLGYGVAAMGGCIVLAGWIVGGLTIYSGRSIQRRRRRMLSIIVAGIDCIWFPFGTILGVFTIVVLMRESVRRLYGE